MGFFDNFKKKEGEISQSSLDDRPLPMPPIPGGENKKPDTKNNIGIMDLPPPPLPKSTEKETPSVFVPESPEKKPEGFDNARAPSNNPGPVPQFMQQKWPQARIEEKNNETDIFKTVDIGQGTPRARPNEEWTSYHPQKEVMFNEPKPLPDLPPLNAGFSAPPMLPEGNFPDVGRGKLKSFDITDSDIEEMPFFPDAGMPSPDLEELPVLEVEDKHQLDMILNRKKPKKPLFVRTDLYSDILNTVDSIKSYTSESEDMIFGLENLKKNMDIEHKRYKLMLEDIQRKIIYVDKVLFDHD